MSGSARTWRGLTFGGGPGTTYHITEETGLDDLDVRSGIRELPRADGAAPGPHYAAARTIVLKLGWGAADPATAEAITAALLDVTGPSPNDLHEYGITRPDESAWFVRGRVARRRIPRTVDTEHIGDIAGTLAIECPDPRIYSAIPAGVVVPEFGADGGGIDLPEDLAWNMDPAELLIGVAVNEGNANAYPLIRFTYPAGETGDADGVTLTNLTTGQEFEVVTTMTAGQTLTADMDALVRATGADPVTLAGSTRYGQWTAPRDPFVLIPGTNLLRFDLDGTAPVVARVDWRHTDL